MFALLFTALAYIIDGLAACGQQFLDWGDAVGGYIGIGEVIAIQCYNVSILFSNLAQLFNDVYAFALDLEDFYESVMDGSLVQWLVDEGVEFLTDLYSTPNIWLQNALEAFWPPLAQVLFDEVYPHYLSFFDIVQNMMTFIMYPGLSIPYFLDYHESEWARLFLNPLGWLTDRLAELDLEFGGLPDDILGWLWEWLLSTAETKFAEIADDFKALGAKIIRFLLEGVFAE